MEPRIRTIIHPSGVKIETPLLIPSFSSKGFDFKKDNISEVCEPLLSSKELLTESMLVSAFDIYNKFLPEPKEFVCTEVTFLDSGGYETSDGYDFSAINKYQRKAIEWKEEYLIKTIREWPMESPLVIVNFDYVDKREIIDNQIKIASKFFKSFDGVLTDFLIKPETKLQNYVQIDEVISKINLLTEFDIIGFTEKEMGNSILTRMLNIAKIRKALDEAKIDKPIHIFGSLDPITSILYFLAGAEIFDGLTWLKFAFHKGTAIYLQNLPALNSEISIHTQDPQVRIKAFMGNINYLSRMKYKMRDYVKSKDFREFNEIGYDGFGEQLESLYKTFLSNLK